MHRRTLTISCADGFPLAAELMKPESAKGCVVIAGALGVPQRFYAAFAAFLVERGYAVLRFDYRGSGGSACGPQRGRDMRMEDWGRLDIDAVLGWTKNELRPGKLFLVGHSAGCQLPGLAANSETLDGMVFIAGSAPHLRHYPMRSWPMLVLTWYFLAPLLSLGRDDFPARQVGLGSTAVAAGVAAQWARWARTRGYLFEPAHGLDLTRYARLRQPLLSYCFLDDSYAPPAAVNALLAYYPSAQIDRCEIARPAKSPIGHFGFFREAQREVLWHETASWLDRQLSSAP